MRLRLGCLEEDMMTRSVIRLVMLLCMTSSVSGAFAQERIPSSDEFSNGPKSHLGPGVTPSASVGVSQMHVDWDVASKRGQSIIEGYVYNSDGCIYFVIAARKLFFWQGDMRAVKSLQVLVHILITLGGIRLAHFLKTYVVHTKGRWARKPLLLEPWQIVTFSEMLRTEPGNVFSIEPDMLADPWELFEEVVDRPCRAH